MYFSQKIPAKNKARGGKKWVQIGSKKHADRGEKKQEDEVSVREQATPYPSLQGNTSRHSQSGHGEPGSAGGASSAAATISSGAAIGTSSTAATISPGAFAVNRNGQVARNQSDGTIASELETGQSIDLAPMPPTRDDRTILVEAELALPSDNRVVDENMVYPDLVQTPEDLEREQRRKRKCLCFVIVIIILLIVVILIVGLVLGPIGPGKSNSDLVDAEQICDSLLLSRDPNIPDQCTFCGDIFGISTEIETRYETLKTFLNITIETNITACEPRNLALLWLANDTIARNLTEVLPLVPTMEPETNFICPRNSHQWTLQRYVLALLHFSLEGRGWPRQQNWLSTEIECEWEGVGCSFGEQKRVLQLDLAGQDASGTIPYEIGKLCDLRRLELGRNRIRGPLPSQLLRQLTSLRRIGVAENMLTGNIPDVMVEEGLDIIQETFGNLTTEQLDGFGEKERELLAGFIDKVLLGGRSPLYVLDFSRNHFFGSVPFGYRLLRHLREVRVDNNNFTGALFPHPPLPMFEDISFFSNLEVFSPSNNSLEGSTPLDIGHLTRLDISFFSDLEVFSASNNSIEGSMPRDIGHLTRLEHLDISFNKLTGTFVTEIGELKELKYLDISFNKLSGTLVTEIGELEELTTLRIGGNRINGTVPTELKNLERLIDLDLSSPLLEEQLPGELCYQTFLEPPIVVHCDSMLINECKCCCCRSDEETEEGEEKERCNAKPKQTVRPP